MKELPSPDTHRGGGIFFTTVDTILAKTRRGANEPVNVMAWVEQAKHTAHELTTDTIFGGANTLLNEHPHEELSTLLHLPYAERRENLETIRRHRRLFLVARDGIILSTEKHCSEEFQSLRKICFTLGRFADSDGREDRHAIAAHTSLGNLLQASKEAAIYRHSDERLKVKYLIALDNMGVNELFHHNDGEHSLHQRRKNFRRAVNTLVLHAAQQQDEQTTHIAAIGLRINTAMGQVSDRIERRATR